MPRRCLDSHVKLVCPDWPGTAFPGALLSPYWFRGQRAAGSGRGSRLQRESSHLTPPPTHPTPQPAPRVRSSWSLWLFSIQPSFPDMKGPGAPSPPPSSQKACLRLAVGVSRDTILGLPPQPRLWGWHCPSLASSLHGIPTSILSWDKCIGILVWRSMHRPLGARGPWAPS